MPKKKNQTPDVPPPPEPRTRRIDLLPDDITRISKLRAFFMRRHAPLDVSEVAAMRLGWKEACQSLGLEQRGASDVEPIGGE